MAKYPLATQAFCDWVDKYKVEIDWLSLFDNDWPVEVKFHHLPIEMQIGILSRFIIQYEDLRPVPYMEGRDTMVLCLKDRFCCIESLLITQHATRQPTNSQLLAG
jgi:hypothetical protein